MRRIAFIISIVTLLITSCEKPVDKGESGNPLLRLYGDAKEDIGYSIAETNDGYIICGKLTIIERGTNDAGSSVITSENEDFGLIKTDRNGIQQWVYNTGGEGQDEGRKVLVMDDGSFVCAGTMTVGTGTETNTDILVTKISPEGTKVWEYHYGGAYDQAGYDILELSSGDGFIVVGSNNDETLLTSNDPGNRDMFFLRISLDGDSLRSLTYGWNTDEFAQKVIYNTGGKYIVAGTTDNSNEGQAGTNIMVAPLTESLSPPDAQIYGGTSDELFSDIVATEDGFSIVGTMEYGTDSKDGLFVKMNYGTLPTSLSFSTFNLGSNVVIINSLLQDTDGCIAAGSTGGTEQSGDMLFLFLDSNGQNLPSPGRFVTGGTGFQTVNDLLIDSEGKVVAVGTNSYENNSLISLLKFDPWE